MFPPSKVLLYMVLPSFLYSRGAYALDISITLLNTIYCISEIQTNHILICNLSSPHGTNEGCKE